MSGSVLLAISTGADWATQITWANAGVGIPFNNPAMEIRQDLNPNSTLIARLDTTGGADGLIQITAPGTILLTLPASVTKNLQPGSAFWDLYLTVYSQRARLLFGSVAIKPHVTSTT